MNRRRAQLLLILIFIPILLLSGYGADTILTGYQPSLELILTVGGGAFIGVFIEAFLSAYIAAKRGKRKQGHKTTQIMQA